jgi:uncharacterized protein DUF5709
VTSGETGDWAGDDIDEPTLLPPEESLDEDELGDDLGAGYSPVERPLGSNAWGTTEREMATREDLTHRLAREERDLDYDDAGDGIGDAVDTDGEPVDDEVGDARAGRLAETGDGDPAYWARDVGVDEGAASGEEAAVHVVPDEDDR